MSCWLYCAAFISCFLFLTIQHYIHKIQDVTDLHISAVNKAFFVSECFRNIVTIGKFQCNSVATVKKEMFFACMLLTFSLLDVQPDKICI